MASPPTYSSEMARMLWELGGSSASEIEGEEPEAAEPSKFTEEYARSQGFSSQAEMRGEDW